MECHVNNVKTVTDHLEALDDAVAEKDLVMILISSLPEDYNNLITALETLKEEQLTWTYVRDRVISEYLRKKGGVKQQSPQDAFTAGNSGGRGGGGGRQNNFNTNKQRNNFNTNYSKGKQGGGGGFQQQQNKKSTMKCHECHEFGHFRRDCPKYL